MITGEKESSILFLSTCPPRECGIATFTQDISNAVEKRIFPSANVKIAAMNRNGVNIYNYPKKVIYQVNDADIDQYIETAKKINENDTIKLVNIQHEFGIFGGEFGSYLIAFLEILKKPCVITLHSILPEPEESMKKVVQSMAEKCNAFIVMANKGKELLRNVYGVKNDIYVIPHGIPTVSFENSKIEKKRIGYEDKIILTSFGMVGPGKGYEDAIDSLPKVVEKFPNLLYLIVGETHPIVRKESGEEYRNYLERKIKKLGLQNHVKFYNKYLKLSEIVRYLKASDIYISSSQNPNQITSGTLVYAMGCGRPVVSTPFLHAKEIVTNERGRLVEFDNSESFSNAIIDILSHPEEAKEMCKNSYHYTRHMTWPNVALNYEKVFNKYAPISLTSENMLPELKLNHLNNMTDEFGIIQFAINTTPDINSGYTTDDNARALIATCLYYDMFKDMKKINLINTYLNYLDYVQQEDGRFFNYVDKTRKVNKSEWGEDTHGRALWSLGTLISTNNIPKEIKDKAKNLFHKAIKPIRKFESPRAISFSILGFSKYQERFPKLRYKRIVTRLADKLVNLYSINSTNDWNWFEKYLTYANSKMSEALFYAYKVTKDKTYLDIGEDSLKFLMSLTFENGIFIPIGQKGWYMKEGKRAYYDQQPIDVASMVQTLVIANKLTDKKEYMDKALNTFQWFLGKNSLNQVIYNESTGGCYDGLGENSININQGAESTVSYLLARLSFT